MFVKREPDEPNLTILEANLVNDCHFVLGRGPRNITGLCLALDSILRGTAVQEPRLPTHNGILTRFGQHELSKPFAAVNIVSVNVSCAEVRKMTKESREYFLGLECDMGIGQLDGSLKYFSYRWILKYSGAWYLNVFCVHSPHFE